MALAAAPVCPTEDVEALLRDGRLALEEGRYADAEALLVRATGGDLPRAFAAWTLLGRARLRLGLWKPARAAFGEALRRAPRFAPAALGRAEALLWMGDEVAAAAAIAALAAAAEPLARAVLLDAELTLAAGAGPSLERLERLAGSAGASPEERFAAEHLVIAAGDPVVACRELPSRVSEKLSFAPAWRALAWARQRCGDQKGAVGALQVACELDDADPVTALVLRKLGVGGLGPLPESPLRLQDVLALWDRGEHAIAAGQAATLLANRPHLVPAVLLVARQAERSGQPWTAAIGYWRVLRQVGPLPAASSRLAEVAARIGLHPLVVCAARQALATSPDGRLWLLLGEAEQARGNPAAAAEAYERALSAPGADLAAIERARGALAFEQLQIDDALAAYGRAIALDPDAAEGIPPFALATLTAGQQRDLARLLERHAEAHPGNVDTLYALATLDLVEGRLDSAAARLRRLESLAPDHVQVLYNLGQLHLRQGRVEEGRAVLARFSEQRRLADADWERHNEAHRRRLAAEEARGEGRTADLVRLLEHNVAESTADLADRRSLAEGLLALGRAADARRESLAVLAALPGDEVALSTLRAAADTLGLVAEVAEAEARLELVRLGCELLGPPGSAG